MPGFPLLSFFIGLSSTPPRRGKAVPNCHSFPESCIIFYRQGAVHHHDNVSKCCAERSLAIHDVLCKVRAFCCLVRGDACTWFRHRLMHPFTFVWAQESVLPFREKATSMRAIQAAFRCLEVYLAYVKQIFKGCLVPPSTPQSSALLVDVFLPASS